MDLYSIGNTNIVSRPSRDGSTLSKEEMQEGARTLETKMRAFRPQAVAIVGKGIWEALWQARTGKKLKKEEFKWGWQEEEAQLGRSVDDEGNMEWAGAKTFVTTSTSGLAASLSSAEKLAIWKPLGEWVTERRKDGGEGQDLTIQC
jgi:thymine-DNA glycosylase